MRELPPPEYTPKLPQPSDDLVNSALREIAEIVNASTWEGYRVNTLEGMIESLKGRGHGEAASRWAVFKAIKEYKLFDVSKETPNPRKPPDLDLVRELVFTLRAAEGFADKVERLNQHLQSTVREPAAADELDFTALFQVAAQIGQLLINALERLRATLDEGGRESRAAVARLGKALSLANKETMTLALGCWLGDPQSTFQNQSYPSALHCVWGLAWRTWFSGTRLLTEDIRQAGADWSEPAAVVQNAEIMGTLERRWPVIRRLVMPALPATIDLSLLSARIHNECAQLLRAPNPKGTVPTPVIGPMCNEFMEALEAMPPYWWKMTDDELIKTLEAADLPAYQNDAYWRDPFTLGHLIYVLSVYEELSATNASIPLGIRVGSVQAARMEENHRDLLRVSGVLANAPGKSGIQLLCEELDSTGGLTRANVLKLRVKVCRAKPCTLEEANSLTLDDVADVLTKPTAARPSKGVPLSEAEVRVRDWLAANAKNNPAAITRDAVADGTGVSGGQVSKTAAWIAFKERRDAQRKPVAREVPLTDAMQAVVPSDCETPDEVAALIEEQKADQAEQERRHKRRHGPS